MKRFRLGVLCLSAAVLLAQAAVPKTTTPALVIPDNEDVVWSHGPGTPDTHTGGGKIEHLLFSSDGKAIHFERTVTGLKVVDAENGKIIRETKTPGFSLNSMRLSTNGKALAAGTSEGKVRTWNALDGSPLKEFKIGNWGIDAMAVSGDGTLIAADPEDGPVQIWDSGKVVQLRELEESRPAGTRMADICFSPDAKRIVTYRGDGAVEIWNTDKGKREHQLPPSRGDWNRVQFTPDGKSLVLSGRGVRIWSFGNEKETGSAKTVPYPEAIDPEKLWEQTIGSRHGGGMSIPGIFGDMAYRDFVSADCTTAATLLATGSIAIWDLKTSTIKRVLDAERNVKVAGGGVVDLAWPPDGNKICCGNEDGTIDIWDLNERNIPSTGRVNP